MLDELSTPMKHTIPPKIFAVYCLAVHSEALWLLSGLEVVPVDILVNSRAEALIYRLYDTRKEK
jgi:hypothetical protein